MFNYHHIVVVDTVTRLHQAKTGLLIQCWIITEPDHHRAGICIEIKFVVTMKQCFKCSSRRRSYPHRLQPLKRRRFVALVVPVTSSLPEIRQSIMYRIALIVLESKFHSVHSPLVKLKLVRYDSYNRTGSTSFGKRFVTDWK